ncbi:MAG: hypothetical protein QNL99_14495 [SAR86 cluster bacterium]
MSDNGAVLIAAPAEYRCGADGSKYVKTWVNTRARGGSPNRF